MSIVIAVCALVGALAGIAGSAAAPSKSSKAKAQAQKKANAKRALKRAFRMRPGPGPGFGGPVHATAVVPKADGSGFDTITTDAGTLKSLDGTTVHIKEGTDKATYKDDVAVDVGSDAKVFRNHEEAKLSDLEEGDHVRVITGAAKGNLVIAESDDFLAKEKQRWRDFKHGRRGHRGFGFGFGPGGPGGPPPPPPADQRGG